MAVRPWIPSDLGAQLAVWVQPSDPATRTLSADGTWLRNLASKDPIGGSFYSNAEVLFSETMLNGRPGFGTSVGYARMTMAYAIDRIPNGEVGHTEYFNGRMRGGSYSNQVFWPQGGVQRSIGLIDNNVCVIRGGNDQYTNKQMDALGASIGWKLGPRINGIRSSILVVDGVVISDDPRNGDFSTGAGLLTIGENGASDQWSAYGDFVLCFGVLSDTDDKLLQGYMAWAGGYQERLPANHPYRAAAPTIDAGGGTPPVETITGNAALKVDDLTVAASASSAAIVVTGAAAVPISGFGVGSAATVAVNASTQIAPGALRVSSTSTSSVRATVVCKPAAVKVAASSTVAGRGAAAVLVSPVIARAAYAGLVLGAASSALDPFAAVSVGFVPTPGAGNAQVTIGPASAVGSSSGFVIGSAAVQGSPLAVRGTAHVDVSGFGLAAIAPVAVTASASSYIRGVATAAIAAVQVAAQSLVRAGAAAAVRIARFAIVGGGYEKPAPPAIYPLPGDIVRAPAQSLIVRAPARDFIVRASREIDMLEWPDIYAGEERVVGMEWADETAALELTDDDVMVVDGNIRIMEQRLAGTVHVAKITGSRGPATVQFTVRTPTEKLIQRVQILVE
jgi:hypothetical protein